MDNKENERESLDSYVNGIQNRQGPEKPCPWILWNISVPSKECVNRIDGMVCKLSDLSSKSECVQSVD